MIGRHLRKAALSPALPAVAGSLSQFIAGRLDHVAGHIGKFVDLLLEVDLRRCVSNLMLSVRIEGPTKSADLLGSALNRLWAHGHIWRAHAPVV